MKKKEDIKVWCGELLDEGKVKFSLGFNNKSFFITINNVPLPLLIYMFILKHNPEIDLGQ